MFYVELPPSPFLRPWIQSLWYCRAPRVAHCRERVLPNGCMQVVLNLARGHLTDCGEDGCSTRPLPRAILVGPRVQYEFVDTRDFEELAGIIIRPGGFAPLFHERADTFFGQSIALDSIWRTEKILERLCEAITPAQKLRSLSGLLEELVAKGNGRSHVVDHAIRLFRSDGLTVARCAQAVGISSRRLSQVFREEVGLSPKAWLRVQRFQLAVKALHEHIEVPWATLALDCGYYDQSHFANDFRSFSGIYPTTYSAAERPWRNHVAEF